MPKLHLCFSVTVAGCKKMMINSKYSASGFMFQGKHCELIFGILMGSPISAIIANLVIQYVEQKAIFSFSSSPKLRKRFVDDAFVIMHF